MNAPIRIGLAGLGLHGQRYAQHLLSGDIADARLVAVNRADAARGRAWADQHGVVHCATLVELAHHPAVDALVAVVPPAVNADALAAAVSAAKPLYLEKPLAPNARTARRMIDIAERTGIPAMVAHTLRYNAVVRALREALERIGTLRVMALNQRFEPSARPWLDDPLQGGIVLNTGVHGFDLLRSLSGAEIVAARGFASATTTRVMEDSFVAALRLEPGPILATLDNSRATGGRSGRIEIAGDDGQLVADHVHGTLAEIRGRTVTPLPVPPPVQTVPAALGDFVRALIEDRPMPIPFAEGLPPIEAAELVHASVGHDGRARA